MGKKLFFFTWGAIIYLETVLRVSTNGSIFDPALLFGTLFGAVFALILLGLMMTVRQDKWLRVSFVLTMGALGVLFASQTVYYRMMRTFYTLYSAGNAGKILEFTGIAVQGVLNNILFVLLMFVPFGAAFLIKKNLNNTFSKHIDIFKTFMRWSEERDYHKNSSFKKFKTTENEIEIIYLTKDELLQLLNFEFKKSKHSHVRDVYCFSCFTGLRFSDVYNLNKSNIHEDHIILNIQKTKSIDHIVPLNKYAKQILERYEGTIYYPLPVISSQKFNEYIKEACELAEINTPVSITRYSGQKRIDDIQPKHQLITSHTARKTFVTNSVIMGMNISVLKKITGHKKEESFRKYVNISEELKKNEMENTWDKMK